MKVIMRKARRTDVGAMNRIFNESMKPDGTCQDIDPKDEAYRLQWFVGHDKKFPVFVGELEEEVICWAALSRYSTDYAYDGVALLEAYTDSHMTIPGLQESVMRFVEEQAQELGFYKLITSVFWNNRSALHTYRTAGYRDVGIYRNHAFYKGELVDVVFMERLLQVNMDRLKKYYRGKYPFYEECFAKEEALQEYQMLRNGMMRAPDDPTKWIPNDKDIEGSQEDWGGATVRPAKNIPSIEEILARKKEIEQNGDFTNESSR